MPALKRKSKFADDELVVCFESFASSQEHGRCAAGTRLLGGHPTVKGWPIYFVPATTPDDQIEAARQAFYREQGAPPPVRS